MTEQVAFDDFARAYRGQVAVRDELEVDLHAHLARVFMRQRRKANSRLRAIRREFGTEMPLTAAARAPHLRASEILMEGDFDEDLDEELEPILNRAAAQMGIALVGMALFSEAAALTATGVLVGGLLQKLREASRTAMSRIDQELAVNYQAGEDFETLTTNVLSIFDRLAGSASAMWARQEAVALLGGIATLAARLGNVPTERAWITQRDAFVRPDHWDADGQIVGRDEPFFVGEEFLAYPGDPDGSVENTANCRCYLLFVPVGGELPE